MKSEPRSEPRPGCLAQELSGDSGIWVALERRTGSCLGISGLAAKIAACLFVICVIRPLIRPHVGSPSSWLCSAPGSTRKGKVAICFPVWPLKLPSALWGLLCFLPVVCVSISPPPLHPQWSRNEAGSWEVELAGMAAVAQRVFPREGRGGALPASAGEP